MTKDTANSADLAREIAKLKKINTALMSRVERAMDRPFNAFSLFETAIGLNSQVRQRTQELQAALRVIERSNDALSEAKQQADAANAFKSTFLTFVTHDLLQPLNAGRLALSALMDVEMNVTGVGLVNQVDRALQALDDLIRTLLDISRLDAGVMVAKISTFQIEQVLEPLRLEFGPMAMTRGLRLHLRPSPAVVKSDPMMLRRVLQNLLANALRYTQRGAILLHCRPRGDALRIEVIDTGPGIAKARHEAIFEEFQRGDGGAADPAGFGLGLAIVRRLAIAMDHPVAIASQPGHGSIFTITVPRDLSGTFHPPATSVPIRQSHYGVEGACILIVENDPAVAQAMVSLLEQWRCRVTAVATEVAARQYMRTHVVRPDLIIADLHLDHGESGFDAIRVVQAEMPRKIPALLITGDYSASVTHAAAERGIEILRKPVKPAELRSLMAYLLA